MTITVQWGPLVKELDFYYTANIKLLYGIFSTPEFWNGV